MKSLGFVVALAALSPAAAAQSCPQPDNLNGPCCAPTFASLPTFPAFSMPGIAICSQQCAPMATPSLAAFPTDFYYGYVDYAFDCQTGAWEMAAVLAHQCDWFVHGNPVFSSSPGVHHPGRSYALVGPDTPGNPFVPGLAPPPARGLIGEGTRATAQIPGVACATEEPLQGSMVPLVQACLCAPAAAPPQLTARRLGTVGACGTSVATIDTLSMGLPWFHLMTSSIGS